MPGNGLLNVIYIRYVRYFNLIFINLGSSGNSVQAYWSIESLRGSLTQVDLGRNKLTELDDISEPET